MQYFEAFMSFSISANFGKWSGFKIVGEKGSPGTDCENSAAPRGVWG